MIILMAGMPGTGKSTLARELARHTEGAVLSKDEIRAALFAAEDIEFSTVQDDFVMDLMLQGATYLWRRNRERVVILDGRTFSRRYQIERVLNFANGFDQRAVILECICSVETARARLDLAPDPLHPATNRNFNLYQQVKARFEPIAHPRTVIDTDQPLQDCVQQALAALR